MAIAWVLTLPAAAAVGAVTYAVTTIFGSGVLGPAIIAVAAIAAVTLILTRRARTLEHRPVGAQA
jgi:PiT family inorganic phosphate transporter